MKLLRIKPLKPFFFGGDINLGKYYYAKSEYFPQNTQLVGALRFFIANQKGLMKGHKNGIYVPKDKRDKAAEIIGDAKPEDFFENDNLGKINFVSPMFVLKDNNAYFPTPLDLKSLKIKNFRNADDEHKKYIKNYSKYYFNYRYLTYKLKKLSNTYYLEGFDYKNIVYQKLGGRKFWEKYINNEEILTNDMFEFSDVFKEVGQVGIELDNKMTVNEKFYSKISYELAQGFEFGVLLDFDGEIKDGFIQIGADGSMFELKVEELNEELKTHPIIKAMIIPQKEGKKFVALSEVIEKEPINSVFRITPVYKTLRLNINKISKNEKIFRKTKEKNVACRGSVFYVDELPEFNLGAYKKMGYNLFIPIKETR